MKTLKSFLPMAIAVFLLTTASLSAQVFNLLHTFGAGPGLTNSDGEQPRPDLILSGNTLYGTSTLGGTNGYGVVFSLNTNGSNLTVLHTFTGGSDGAYPNKDLVLSGGTLYGLVAKGPGLSGYGAVFSMETNGGDFTNFYTFSVESQGAIGQPNGGLILSAGTLYGTAYQGGVGNAGSIFSINTNGTLNWSRLFNSPTDGENPLGTLVLSDGTLYGTARNGGSNGLFGTVFFIETNGGDFTVLHTFEGHTNLDAQNPDAGLVLSGGTLYGTTVFGGTNDGGTVFSITTNGGDYSVLHSFSDTLGGGKYPEAGLALQGAMLYGTTLGNGTSLTGTIFSVETNGGDFTLLYAFSDTGGSDGNTNSDGSQPYGGLTVAGNRLYGTASVGGINGMGTLFSLAIVPEISSLSIVGPNLVLSGVNGIAGETCSLLASPGFNLPLSQWLPVATNVLSADGSFTITATNAVNPAAPQQFYVLKLQ